MGRGYSGFGTEIDLTGSVPLNDRVIIDEPPGTGAHSLHAKLQIIQTFKASDNFSIVNNTFYDYMNRYNQTEDYYADTAKGSYTIENKTDFKIKFPLGSVNHDIDGGFTYRYAHVLDIQNFVNEPVSVFDLSQSPNTWIFPASLQAAAGAFLYNAAFNHLAVGASGTFSGTPGPNGYSVSGFLNGTVDSNLQDAAIFLEHRMQFSPQWSVLYGLRGDLVQLNYSDPLGGPDYGAPPGLSALPQSASTNWYGLYNGNISVVYSPSSHVSTYLTYNKAQYVLPTANDGAIATWGEDPTWQLRQNTLLEELGVKFDLLDKALFISSAIFKQERTITTGVGGLAHTLAHIKGAEIELNYQPDPHFFATASYSYLHTTLDSPATFYNFPAQPGINYDGAGVSTAKSVPAEPDIPGSRACRSTCSTCSRTTSTSPASVLRRTFRSRDPSKPPSPVISIWRQSSRAYPGLPPSLVGAYTASGGYYQSPKIPWQYTLNAAAFYSFQKYTVKFSIYNLTDQHNLTNDIPFYGNDFLTRQPPRSYDLTLSGKF